MWQFGSRLLKKGNKSQKLVVSLHTFFVIISDDSTYLRVNKWQRNGNGSQTVYVSKPISHRTIIWYENFGLLMSNSILSQEYLFYH